MDIKKVLDKLVEAGRKAYDLDTAMLGLGYSGTPYFDIFCGITDVIFQIVGDRNVNDQSVTTLVMFSESMTNEERVQALLHEYEIQIARAYVEGSMNR